MNKWFIYLATTQNTKTKEVFSERRYYKRKLNKLPEGVLFVGEAMLEDNFFIPNSETAYTSFIDLNDISICYTAELANKQVANFEHTLLEMLYKAKEGIMPYLSFAGFKVSKKPIIKIHGRKHNISKPLNLNYEI